MTIKAYVNVLAASTKVWPTIGGWVGLGSLQCLGVLLFWVIVGQGPAVLAFFSHLSCLPLSFPFLYRHGLA